MTDEKLAKDLTYCIAQLRSEAAIFRNSGSDLNIEPQSYANLLFHVATVCERAQLAISANGQQSNKTKEAPVVDSRPLEID